MPQFNKALCQRLRVEIQEALKAVESKMNITISVGNMSYDESEINVKIKVYAESKSAVPNIKDFQYKFNLKKYGWMFDLDESDFGKAKFIPGKGNSIFIGTKDRHTKYPYVYKDINGETFLSNIRPRK